MPLAREWTPQRCTKFGSITLFFIGRDAENDEAEVAGAKSIEALQEEIKALRADIQALSRQNPEQEKTIELWILVTSVAPKFKIIAGLRGEWH